MWHRKIPKAKKGAWYVRVGGSYLPASWQGWLMHLVLLLGGIGLIIIAYNDGRPLITAATSLVLELVGWGAVFTWLASKKA